MNIHEFQAKEILQAYGIPIPEFKVVSDFKDVINAVQALGVQAAVVKVQVHAGGRGKAGGVKIGKTPKEIETLAKGMIGMKLVTKQTGKAGIICHKVMISKLLDIAKEYYVGIVIDRKEAAPILMVSPEGGTEIEELAENSPEKILKVPFGLDGTISVKKCHEIAHFLGFTGKQKEIFEEIIRNLCKAFVENDMDLLEINPLIEDKEGTLWALDAKIAVDDNALFRHPNIALMYDPSQETPEEAIAHDMDLAYIALEGNIGCMVNGAGLAMATMDLIKHHGGMPANFLDVGGGASREKVSKSFALILADKNVKAILINIFGGIMRCDILAEGIVAAAGELDIEVPLIVRLEGTNVEKGKEVLRKSGLKIISADNLTEAAEKAVKAALGKEGSYGHFSK
jgi:succinyl-CoA synthetase beta subunit